MSWFFFFLKTIAEIRKLMQNRNSGKKEHASQPGVSENPRPACISIFLVCPNWMRRMFRSMKHGVWTRAVKCPAVSMIMGAAFVGKWKEVIPECARFVILQRACSLPEGSPYSGYTGHFYRATCRKMELCTHNQTMVPKVLSAEWFLGNFKILLA